MTDYLKTTIETYDKTIKEYKKNVLPLVPEEIESFMSQMPKSGKVLDLGCGFGRDCIILKKNGFDVTGIDLSKGMIKEAKKLKSVDFRVMDARKLRFPKDNFDGVWACASLLHLRKKEIGKTLSEIYRVLKLGGICFISVKEGKDEGVVKDERYGGAPKFYAYYKKNEFADLLKKAGFKVIDSYYKELASYAKIKAKREIIIFARK